MAQDNEIKLQIGVETDESSIARAKRSIDGLEGSVKDVANEIKKAGRVGDFDEVTAGAKKAESAVESLGDAARQTAKEIEAATQRANDQFDQVSNNVGLAGDLESNARTLGGAISAFGGQQLGGAVGTIAEIPAVVEALPRLKVAFAGLPATLGSAVTALGPVGIAFGAAAAAIAAAVVVAQKGVEDLKRATAARLSAEEDIATQIAGGLTTGGAQAQLAELKRLQELQTELVRDAENERKKVFEQSVRDAGGLDVSGRLREALGLTTSGEVDEAFNRRKEALAETTARINELSKALESGELAADAAAPAIQSIATTLPQVTQASNQRVSTERQYQAALQQTSAIATQSARAQRESINREANAADRARAQERRQRIADTVARIRDRQRGEQEEVQAAADNRGEILRDFYNREANELVRHQQNLEDIRLNAQRAERDALRSGDIFALRDIRERASDQFTDAGRDFQFNQGMRAREFAQSNNNVTFNITNADPQAVAYQIQRQLAGTLR